MGADRVDCGVRAVKVDPQRLPERARFFTKPYDEKTVAETIRKLIAQEACGK
jgi:hypothetical protein